MSAVTLLLISIAVLLVGYVTYGKWLADQWGIDEKKVTPSHELEDGLDYVPAKAPVLLGHHFSSIAGAGPINGPIQAAVFGWVPVLLWVLIGGIFFGATHDFGALFASIRHKGQSIVADTFKATFTETGAVDIAASAANASTAMISILFILIAIAFGFFVYRRNASLVVSTVIGVIAIVACIAIGLNWHPLYLTSTTWMVIVGAYILVASVTPVWILLQPRDYLSSFLLYGMMALAIVGIIGSHPTLDIPAFTGFVDTIAPTGTSLGYLFPALFVTIACGAISGFHSLVASGTTAKQLNSEKDARPIAYGSMLVECALAVIAVCAVGYIWKDYAAGTTVTPTVVFASGIAGMLSQIPGLTNVYNIAYSLLVLTVSVFCLTSLDTATRLARYMFQEFWLAPGETRADVSGFKKTITNPYIATLITVVLGISLGLTGYANIWALFGAANQLLAALGLLAVAAWLGNMGKNNKMLFFPMVFMLVATVVSLALTIKSNVIAITAGSAGLGWCYIRAILAILLIALAVILMIEGISTIKKQFNKVKQTS